MGDFTNEWSSWEAAWNSKGCRMSQLLHVWKSCTPEFAFSSSLSLWNNIFWCVRAYPISPFHTHPGGTGHHHILRSCFNSSDFFVASWPVQVWFLRMSCSFGWSHWPIESIEDWARKNDKDMLVFNIRGIPKGHHHPPTWGYGMKSRSTGGQQSWLHPLTELEVLRPQTTMMSPWCPIFENVWGRFCLHHIYIYILCIYIYT